MTSTDQYEVSAHPADRRRRRLPADLPEPAVAFDVPHHSGSAPRPRRRRSSTTSSSPRRTASVSSSCASSTRRATRSFSRPARGRRRAFDGPRSPTSCVDPQTPVLAGQPDRAPSEASTATGPGPLVNPVQIVRWELMPAHDEPAQYQRVAASAASPSRRPSVDPTKYDLVRSYVDAVTRLSPSPTTEESSPSTRSTSSSRSRSTRAWRTLQPAITTYPFDNAANAPWAHEPRPKRAARRRRDRRASARCACAW